ncbi:hypothetical protein [Shewanella frigidimarina]|uniref:hypothetical protein n=1 Tax=Shewanella frigidimarina TaxID=56812 RepID=UPI003D79115C
MKKYPLTLLAVFVLSACGGGGDESNTDSGTDPATPPSSNYVSGNVVQSGSNGYLEYPTTDIGSGYYCADNSDKYFESASVIVYANSAVSDNDMMAVATNVQNNAEPAYNAMKFTELSLSDFKPEYSPQIASNLINYREYNNQSVSEYVYSGIYNQVEWHSFYEIAEHYQSLSPKETLVANEYLIKFHDQDDSYFSKRSKKIVVCLSPGMGNSRFAEGTFHGINFAEPKADNRVLQSVYAKHELIHHVQMQHYRISSGGAILIYSLPRWLTEGQAIYLAGQSIAKRSEVSSTSIDDMNNALDLNLYYPEYGLAYSYIHLNNNIDAINSLYTKTASDLISFEEAFDSIGLKNHYGEVMTYSSFKANYQTWVANWN